MDRPVLFLAAPAIPSLPAVVRLPSRHFIVLVALDARPLATATLVAFAERVLKWGAVYVVCWGPGCVRVEDAFDEAATAREASGAGVIMTTSHPDETLDDAIAFVRTCAVPDEAYRRTCGAVLLLTIGSETSAQALARAAAGS